MTLAPLPWAKPLCPQVGSGGREDLPKFVEAVIRPGNLNSGALVQYSSSGISPCPRALGRAGCYTLSTPLIIGLASFPLKTTWRYT